MTKRKGDDTHWSPDQSSNLPTIGVCGEAGGITMHLDGSYAGLRTMEDACKVCLYIAKTGATYPALEDRVRIWREVNRNDGGRK